MYRDQNSPGGVVERETGVAGGSDCGSGDDVTVAIAVRRKGRKMVRIYMYTYINYGTYTFSLQLEHTPDIIRLHYDGSD